MDTNIFNSLYQKVLKEAGREGDIYNIGQNPLIARDKFLKSFTSTIVSRLEALNSGEGYNLRGHIGTFITFHLWPELIRDRRVEEVQATLEAIKKNFDSPPWRNKHLKGWTPFGLKLLYWVLYGEEKEFTPSRIGESFENK